MVQLYLGTSERNVLYTLLFMYGKEFSDVLTGEFRTCCSCTILPCTVVQVFAGLIHWSNTGSAKEANIPAGVHDLVLIWSHI